MTQHPLDQWLRQTRIPQDTLARAAGTQQSRIARFLAGICGFSPKVAKRLVAATEELGRDTVPKPTPVKLDDILFDRPPKRVRVPAVRGRGPKRRHRSRPKS